MPDGSQAYTRDGAFQLSPEGQIVTLQGYEVDPGIVMPENTVKVEISEHGTVMAYVENDPVPVELGQLTMATFINEAGMRADRQQPAAGHRPPRATRFRPTPAIPAWA